MQQSETGHRTPLMGGAAAHVHEAVQTSDPYGMEAERADESDPLLAALIEPFDDADLVAPMFDE